LREAKPEDLPDLLGLYAQLTQGTPSAAPGDESVSIAALNRVLQPRGRHLLVAVIDGEVVGTADLAVIDNVTHHGMPWGIVENVVVRDDLRRRGVARALLAEIEQIARAANCHKVGLLSGKHRLEAHALYEQAGYRPVAEGFKLYFDR